MNSRLHNPKISDCYMPPGGPVASGVKVVNLDDNYIYLRRLHICYADNPERDYKLRWDAWNTSNWQPVPIGEQLRFI
jgi:hypothetical protein